jgi:hypothetical protein
VTLGEKWVKAPLSDFELKIEGRISEKAKNRGQQRIGVLEEYMRRKSDLIPQYASYDLTVELLGDCTGSGELVEVVDSRRKTPVG